MLLMLEQTGYSVRNDTRLAKLCVHVTCHHWLQLERVVASCSSLTHERGTLKDSYMVLQRFSLRFPVSRQHRAFFVHVTMTFMLNLVNMEH